MLFSVTFIKTEAIKIGNHFVHQFWLLLLYVRFHRQTFNFDATSRMPIFVICAGGATPSLSRPASSGGIPVITIWVGALEVTPPLPTVCTEKTKHLNEAMFIERTKKMSIPLQKALVVDSHHCNVYQMLENTLHRYRNAVMHSQILGACSKWRRSKRMQCLRPSTDPCYDSVKL